MTGPINWRRVAAHRSAAFLGGLLRQGSGESSSTTFERSIAVRLNASTVVTTAEDAQALLHCARGPCSKRPFLLNRRW